MITYIPRKNMSDWTCLFYLLLLVQWCVHVYVCWGLCADECRYCGDQRHQILQGAGVTGGSELPNMNSRSSTCGRTIHALNHWTTCVKCLRTEFIFIYVYCVPTYLYVRHVCAVIKNARRGYQSLWSWITGSFEPPWYRCQEPVLWKSSKCS